MARRFTQTVQVTIRGMSTIEVIAAGVAARPAHLGEGAVQGISPGTWLAGTTLGPGTSYTVRTYSPAPTAAELAADRRPYPAVVLAGELTLELPASRLVLGGSDEVQFPAFGGGVSVRSVIGPPGVDGAGLIAAYALARRLASRSPTAYAFALAVERFLSPANGFVYDEHPPRSRYPIESFLFSNRRGYCQQFAGAMALLLRMGGVPARVATGFTTGDYDSAFHQYAVSDVDAHAWVEAWFPGYGWVRFDPTPAAAPARAGGSSVLSARGAAGTSTPAAPLRRTPTALQVASAHGSRSARSGGGPSLALLILGPLALLALAAAGVWSLMAAPRSGRQLVAELERALARCGRPAADGVTLAALEHRFRTSPDAESYVRCLRLARFAGAAELPSRAQRRALRVQLAAGLGLSGRLRAWWALPPRPRLGRVLH
jgi:transglutaminase-like putative cysteine protease